MQCKREGIFPCLFYIQLQKSLEEKKSGQIALDQKKLKRNKTKHTVILMRF